MICPNCLTRWADFPIDITKQKMTMEQEQKREADWNSDEYRECLACQTDMMADV